MALFSSSNPSVRGRVLVKFPARVLAGTGMSVTKASGVYTFAMDVSALTVKSSVAVGERDNLFFTVYDSDAPTNHKRVSIETLLASVPAGGNVVGAASSTDNALARFNGTAGLTIQNSGIIIDDSNNITGIANLAASTIAGGVTTITASNASALTVGRQGATSPALQVHTSTASSASGIAITAAAAGGGVDLAAISSASNESLTINAKVLGTISIGVTSTGNVILCGTTNNAGVGVSPSAKLHVKGGGTDEVLRIENTQARGAGGPFIAFHDATGRKGYIGYQDALNDKMIIINELNEDIFIYTNSAHRMTITAAGTVQVHGVLTVASATATPAAGSAAAVLLFGTTAGFGIYYGSGAPTVSAAQGSIYIRSDGSSTSTRLYVNTTGSTTWTNFTSAA